MKKILGMCVLLAAMCAFTAWWNPSFLQVTNMQNLSRHIALLAIFAIGEGVVILCGGIDLSVGSLIALGGLIAMTGAADWGYSPWAMSGLVIVFCALVGLGHGYLIGVLKLQPFVVTLCSMLFFRGLARGLVTDRATGLGLRYEEFQAMGGGLLGPIPIPVVVLAVVAVVVAFFLHFTKYGRYLYAIGRNEKAVAYSGVNVTRMKMAAYVLCAVLAGIAGLLYAGYTNSVQPASTGQAYELYAIAAAVLGGCSMRAGEGSVIGIIVGASILKTLTNAINLLGISTLWEQCVIGTVILIGVSGDALYKWRAMRSGSAGGR
jgi:ribose transport system permease protein